MQPTATVLSPKAFWKLCHSAEYSQRRFELVKGEVVELALADGLHGECAAELVGWIGTYVKQKRLGRCTAGGTGYILSESDATVRAPDIGFVRLERAPEPFGPGFIPLVPDLAVVVISPSEKVGDVENKLRDYLRYGVRLIWMIYPGSHVMVYSHGTVRRLIVDDQLDGDNVLPGFSVRVGDIFPS